MHSAGQGTPAIRLLEHEFDIWEIQCWTSQRFPGGRVVAADDDAVMFAPMPGWRSWPGVSVRHMGGVAGDARRSRWPGSRQVIVLVAAACLVLVALAGYVVVRVR